MTFQKPKRRLNKKPLFRKVNTRTHGVHHGSRGKYRWDRNTKSGNALKAKNSGMVARRNGLDYTPLFRFLVSKVGQDWDSVYGEAVGRLDSTEPIFWVVAREEHERKPVCRVGESSYYSGLFVDHENILQLTDPDLQISDLMPSCPCCTHTFNGEPFVNAFDPGNHDLIATN